MLERAAHKEKKDKPIGSVYPEYVAKYYDELDKDGYNWYNWI